MPSWSRIATRTRVPLGFVFAAAYLWLARPQWLWLAGGCILIVIGILVRAAASGHIRKNRELTTTGPYAYTRNPLYLGSLLIAAGFILAARSLWIAVVAALMFFFVYVPVIRAEEKYLSGVFPDYLAYASQVPRLIPRMTPYGGRSSAGGEFSKELYLKHREYNAALGSALMVGALILKIILVKH